MASLECGGMSAGRPNAARKQIERLKQERNSLRKRVRHLSYQSEVAASVIEDLQEENQGLRELRRQFYNIAEHYKQEHRRGHSSSLLAVAATIELLISESDKDA